MESYNVIIEAPALLEIDGIFDYITNTLKEPDAAERVCNSIETALLSLRQLPMRHGVIGEGLFAAKEIRKMPAENYIVFYTVDTALKEVNVLRVMYGRRDWQNLI